MRNLKRALSLAMASVMLLGMMVVGTSAAYNDVTSEQNKEAIEVLQTVGIMTGDENGNFNPDANVTRNEMAVVMANLMDYRVATYAGTSPFTDVPDWAEPYVAACWTNGITSGYSSTIYGGNDSVTTAQAALMLMKVLGYFQYQSDFGEDWQLATVKQANKIDLFDDVNSGVTQAMTRNDLAQLVLNTLEATMVEPDDTTIDVSTGDVSVNIGQVKYNDLYKTGAQYSTFLNAARDGAKYTVELAEELYGSNLVKTAYTTDSFGRPATKWTYKSTTIGTFADQPIATYTAKASRDTLYTLVGSSVVDDLTLKNAPLVDGDTDKLVVYVDGVQDTATSKTSYFGRNSSAGGVSGKGVQTEVYLDNDGNVTLVYINTYLMQASNSYSENKGTINVTVKTKPEAAFSANVLDIDDFDAIADFKADDYILYTASKKTGTWDIKSVAKAEVVTGTVDAFSTGDSGYVKIEGTQYDYAKKAATDATNGYLTEYVVTDTASVVVDANGYVLYVDNASISVGNYVYIAAAAASSTLQSKVIADAYFSDGTHEEITVKELFERASVGGALNASATVITSRDDTLAGWYAYTKNSKDEYTLKQAKTSDQIGSDSAQAINNGKVAIGTAAANADTIFVVKQTDGNKTVTVYTGITNVPNIKNATVYAMNAKDDSSKKLSLVYVEAAKANIDNATTESVLFLLKHDSTYVDTADNEKVYVWNALLNGEETKIESKTIDNSTYAAGDVFEDYSMDGDGYYEVGNAFSVGTKTAKSNLRINNSDVIALSGNTLTLGTKDYVVDDDTVINLVMLPAANANGTTLKNDIMTDDNAKYEVGLKIGASDLEGRFDGYKVTGTVYATYVDDKTDTDLLASVYVVITAVQAV